MEGNPAGRWSARNVAATVNEPQDSDEQADCGEQQNHDAMAKGRAAFGAGGCGALVAHRAALGQDARHRQRHQSHKARG